MAKAAAKSTSVRAGRKADVFGAAPVVATDPPKKRGRPSTVAAVTNEPFVELEPTPATPKKRGRPKAAAAEAVEDAPQPTPKSLAKPTAKPTSTLPKKRGRPAKTAAAETIATPPKKKSGRPKAAAAEAIQDAPTPKSRPGRPAKTAAAEAVEDAPQPTPKSRPGRPKTAAAKTVAIPPKKRAGRPTKVVTASSLNRVAGSPRVSKRAPAKRASTAATAKPAVTKQETASVQPPKKRGRKAATQTATKATAGPGRGRPRKDASAPVAAKKAPKTARQAISKPVAPRKRRGYTALEVPDKFAAQMQQHLLDLEAAEKAPEETADEEAGEEQEHIFQDQDVNTEVTPIDEDENAEEGAQEEVQLVVFVKPTEEETYEEEAEDVAGDPDQTVGEIEVEYEIREETIIEEPTNPEFQMQGDIEDELNRAVSSELTPSYDDDFEESAHDASILQQALGANDASGLLA